MISKSVEKSPGNAAIYVALVAGVLGGGAAYLSGIGGLSLILFMFIVGPLVFGFVFRSRQVVASTVCNLVLLTTCIALNSTEELMPLLDSRVLVGLGVLYLLGILLAHLAWLTSAARFKHE